MSNLTFLGTDVFYLLNFTEGQKFTILLENL